MTALRVTCLQLEPRNDDVALGAYLEKVFSEIRSAGSADLVVLPELWHVGYFGFDRYADEAMAPEDTLLEDLANLARELSIVLHIGSFLESGPPRSNTTLVFGPDGSVLAQYRKIHLFGYGSREQDLLSGGRQTAWFPIAGVNAGLAICYDLRFPELFRSIADKVALFVVPATWPASRIGHWSTLIQARAIENQAFVIGCNAAGANFGVDLGGKSVIVGPNGDIIAEASTAPGRIDASIDVEESEALRLRFPALADRVWPSPSVVAQSECTEVSAL